MSEIVIITGASSGIGEATAYAFAREGASLFLVARREKRLEEIAHTCYSEGSPVVRVQKHDLSRKGEGGKLVQECLESLGGLDVLICNAGYGVFGPVADISPEEMERIWQVNYQSGYESIHRALPHFLEQEKGHIVLTSSIIGKKGMPFSAPYSATKFAQVGLGEALWGELKGLNIGISVICPGYTATEFHEAARKVQGTETPSREVKGQSPKAVAEAILKAVRKNQREVHLTFAGKLLLGLNRFSSSLATRILTALARRQAKSQQKLLTNRRRSH